MKLKLAETFTSIQGEGHLAGKRMFFIRFAGCNIADCPMHPVNANTCDTNWMTQQTLDGAGALSALADVAQREVGVGGWVSITGGEPTNQFEAMNFLAGELRNRQLQLNIQTAGQAIIPCPWDWLTVSPKGSRAKMRQDFGQELKLVYTGQSLGELIAWYNSTKFWNYYLMPYWENGRCNMKETVDMVHAAYQEGMRWELTTQMHKWAGIP